jgi:hypothetical protein
MPASGLLAYFFLGLPAFEATDDHALGGRRDKQAHKADVAWQLSSSTPPLPFSPSFDSFAACSTVSTPASGLSAYFFLGLLAAEATDDHVPGGRRDEQVDNGVEMNEFTVVLDGATEMVTELSH